MDSYRKRFSVHLLYYWPVYIVLAVSVTVFWILLFKKINKIPQEKQINFFIAADSVNEELLIKELKPLLTDLNISEINVDSFPPADEQTLLPVISTRGVIDTDIVILPQLQNINYYINNFVPLDSAFIKDYLPNDFNADFLEYNNEIYGIKIYDAANGVALVSEDLFSFGNGSEERDYYLFLNKNSENIGSLSPRSISENTQALTAVQYLLSNAGAR